jgi:oligopeptide/dipeptide ABC transporter ATP-binding protein
VTHGSQGAASKAALNGQPEGSRDPLIEMREIRRLFLLGRHQQVMAVDGVDLDIPEGVAVGLVGESGSGKTTLGRCLLRLIDVTGGSIRFGGEEITQLRGQKLRALRSQMQMVFQDPVGSLDPRQSVFSSVEEPLRLLTDAGEKERRRRVTEILERVRLSMSHLGRYPHQLSGGQQQRVGIARAIVTRPRLCVLDEPTSALDWPIRAEMLELLDELRGDLGLSYLVISHDLGAVRRVCDRIAVMYLGRIVEEAPGEELFANPSHPYTKALLSARLEPELDAGILRSRLGGDVPSPIDPPSGCHLHPRCPIAVEECARVTQELQPIGPDHRVACMRVTGGEEIDWPPDWETGGELERTVS